MNSMKFSMLLGCMEDIEFEMLPLDFPSGKYFDGFIYRIPSVSDIRIVGYIDMEGHICLARILAFRNNHVIFVDPEDNETKAFDHYEAGDEFGACTMISEGCQTKEIIELALRRRINYWAAQFERYIIPLIKKELYSKKRMFIFSEGQIEVTDIEYVQYLQCYENDYILPSILDHVKSNRIKDL